MLFSIHEYRQIRAYAEVSGDSTVLHYASLLLNEHGELYFLSHNKSVHIIGQKKRYTQKRGKKRYSGIQIMTAKTTTTQTLYAHVVLNGVIFRQISYGQAFSQVLL